LSLFDVYPLARDLRRVTSRPAYITSFAHDKRNIDGSVLRKDRVIAFQARCIFLCELDITLSLESGTFATLSRPIALSLEVSYAKIAHASLLEGDSGPAKDKETNAILAQPLQNGPSVAQSRWHLYSRIQTLGQVTAALDDLTDRN
jgi:hypothetical protein